MLQVRIVIIQDEFEVGFHYEFDSQSLFGGKEFPQSSSFRNPPLVKKTCYLLRFDDGTPLGMCHWTQFRFKHFVYLDEMMDEISPEERMIAYKGRVGTQDLRWHPTNIDSWENLFEKDMLRNDSSAKEDICSPPDHSKPIVDAIMVAQQDVREGGKREDDSGTGQKSISLSPAIAGSLPKSDQQANDQNDPSKPQVDAITVAQQIKGGGGKKDDEIVVLVNSLPKSNQLADDQTMNVGEVGKKDDDSEDPYDPMIRSLSNTGQKSITSSLVNVGSLPKSDQQTNDPSKPIVDAIMVAQQDVNSEQMNDNTGQDMDIKERGEDKLDNQKSGDEGRDMEEEKGSSGGKELGNQKMMGGEGEKAEDDSESDSNDEVTTSQNDVREKDNSKGVRHSREKIIKIELLMDEDEIQPTDYKDLWRKIKKLPQKLQKIMMADNQNTKKAKKKKRTPPSMNVKIYNSVTMYREEQQGILSIL